LITADPAALAAHETLAGPAITANGGRALARSNACGPDVYDVHIVLGVD
jgi:hypothetical protein